MQMLFDRFLPARATARPALLCLLLLALLLHGQAGVLRQLLGSVHWHQQAQAATPAAQPGWPDRLQAWRQQLRASSPLAGGHAPTGHHHRGGERHHHGHDSTVVALERGGHPADPLADTPAGSLVQPLGLAERLRWVGPSPTAPRWPAMAAAAWRDAGLRLPERPPRA